MVKKIGQMRIQQTAFMLIALTMLFVIVGIFILQSSLSGLKGQKSSVEQKTANELVSRLAGSPELTCGTSFSMPGANCIDFDKAMALKGMSQNYLNFWGVKGIEIRKIYPNETNSDSCKNIANPLDCTCTQENYPNCNYLDVFSTSEVGNSSDVSTFVSLCYKKKINDIVQEKCELGKIIVRY